jgi:L-seryl-tRNA(Ser) seleniumtransferase
VAVASTRSVLGELREAIRGGALTALPDVGSRVDERASTLLNGGIRPVINATGIVLHTNLGRAPWSPEACAAALRVAQGYCDLEIDLATGERGGRTAGVERLICHLTGAESALVVNNGAAALLLALSGLAAGREVVVSRGESVEIGGSFRVPDVVSSGGARLVDVGTTNRTRIDDYAAAIASTTAVLLRVHPSNFRLIGFAESPSRRELVALARSRGVAVVEDLGSGYLGPEGEEPSVPQAVADGVDVAVFSGDKWLGGPQAGLIVGRAQPLRVLRHHPLYRALRVDKVTIAALEATLALHASGRPTAVAAMADLPLDALVDRARWLADRLARFGVPSEATETTAYLGGGSWPGQEIASMGVRCEVAHPDRWAKALRSGDPPVVARVRDGALWLDVRTLTEEQLTIVADRLALVARDGYVGDR